MASPRVGALAIGHMDLARELGLTGTRAVEGVLLHARCQVVLAARAAGREAIDTVFMGPGDVEGLRAEAQQARRLVEALDAVVAAGDGLLVFEGRLVGLPVVEAQRALLERARRSRGA